MSDARRLWLRVVCLFRGHDWLVSATVTGVRDEGERAIMSAEADVRCLRCGKIGKVSTLKGRKGTITLSTIPDAVPIPGEARS